MNGSAVSIDRGKGASVLLEHYHAEEGYAAEGHPIGHEDPYAETPIADVVAALDQRPAPCYQPHPGVAATMNQCFVTEINLSSDGNFEFMYVRY